LIDWVIISSYIETEEKLKLEAIKTLSFKKFTQNILHFKQLELRKNSFKMILKKKKSMPISSRVLTDKSLQRYGEIVSSQIQKNVFHSELFQL